VLLLCARPVADHHYIVLDLNEQEDMLFYCHCLPFIVITILSILFCLAAASAADHRDHHLSVHPSILATSASPSPCLGIAATLLTRSVPSLGWPFVQLSVLPPSP
jgi:hypothetical protein